VAKRKRVVWVVTHYEYVGHPDLPWVDALQFHVSSSLAKAEKIIRAGCGYAPHSWWQIHPHTVDDTEDDEGREVYYYNHRGMRLKAAPVARAKAAFVKFAARDPEHYPVLGWSKQS